MKQRPVASDNKFKRFLPVIFLLILPAVFFLGLYCGAWVSTRTTLLSPDLHRFHARNPAAASGIAYDTGSTPKSGLQSIENHQGTGPRHGSGNENDGGIRGRGYDIHDGLNDDDSLLRAATKVEGEVVKRGGARKPKIAFLFMTRGPLPIAPLWARFFESGKELFSIYIHTAASFSYKDGELPEVFAGAHIPSKDVKWGDISIVDAERRLLAHALLDPLNHRFALLSESCIPLFPFPTLYDYLFASEISYVRLKNESGRNGMGRYSASFLPLVPPHKWLKGGQWFTLNRVLAHAVVADGVFHPLFRRYCRDPCYSDEHYLPTLLNILAPSRSVVGNRTVTWTDWSKGGPHPAEFHAADVSIRLIERIRGPPSCTLPGNRNVPCYLFARKFMKDSVAALLAIADKMGL